MGIDMSKMPKAMQDRVLGHMGKLNMSLVCKRTGPKPQNIVTPKDDLEGAVKKECMAVMEALSLVCWRMNTGAMKTEDRYVRFGTPGMADIIGLLPDGRFLGVECKRRHGGKQSDDQEDFQEDIEGSKGVYILVHSAGELVDKLKAVM